MFEISADCHAKVNLALAILGRDVVSGMHYIDSVIAKIKLKDVITVKPRRGKGIKVSFAFAPGVRKERIDPADNTITRLYSAVQDVLGVTLPSLAVSVEKHIPAGGGLGGGSSDAAGFAECLVVLAREGDLGDISEVLDEAETEDWYDIARAVGMDTYAFMLSASILRMRGFGEACEAVELPGLEGYRCAVIDPGLGLSTTEMYGRVKKHSLESHVEDFLQEWRLQAMEQELLRAHGPEARRRYGGLRFGTLDEVFHHAKNDFTDIARKASKEVAAVLHEYEGRFPLVSVTGSGSCVIVVGKPKAIRSAGLTPYRFLA
jgi:4-diphosphocytidyl-2C-methyl-D-erythritol kinase